MGLGRKLCLESRVRACLCARTWNTHLRQLDCVSSRDNDERNNCSCALPRSKDCEEKKKKEKTNQFTDLSIACACD